MHKERVRFRCKPTFAPVTLAYDADPGRAQQHQLSPRGPVRVNSQTEAGRWKGTQIYGWGSGLFLLRCLEEVGGECPNLWVGEWGNLYKLDTNDKERRLKGWPVLGTRSFSCIQAQSMDCRV